MKQPSSLDVDEATNLFSSALGEYVWWVRCVDDRVLRMEFGEPHLSVHGPFEPNSVPDSLEGLPASRRVVVPTGKWSLFVEDGAWSVATAGMTCDRISADTAVTDLCLSRLSGQKLSHVDIFRDDISLRLGFDLGGLVSIKFSSDFEQNDQWNIILPSGKTLCFTNSRKFELEDQGSTP